MIDLSQSSFLIGIYLVAVIKVKLKQNMPLSAEAIVGIVGLLLALLPSIFVVSKIIRQRGQSNANCSMFPRELVGQRRRLTHKHIDEYRSPEPSALPLSHLNRQTSHPLYNEDCLEAGLLRCSYIPNERFHDPGGCRSIILAGALAGG